MSFTWQKGDRQANLGAPLDVTTQDLRIESLFPADEETQQLFRATAI